MCETVLINIDNIMISISIFVVGRSDHKLLFKKLFQRAAHMSFINMNDKLFKMILRSLNEKKRMNFLKMFTEHFSNKKKSQYSR